MKVGLFSLCCLFLHFYLLILCMFTYKMRVEVKRQLCAVSSLFLPLHRFQSWTWINRLARQASLCAEPSCQPLYVILKGLLYALSFVMTVLLVYSKLWHPLVYSDRTSPNQPWFSSAWRTDQDSREQRAGFLKLTSWVFPVPSCSQCWGLQYTGAVITHRTWRKQYPEFQVCIQAPKTQKGSILWY